MRNPLTLLRPIAPLVLALLAFAPAHASVGDWGANGLEISNWLERNAAIVPDRAGGLYVLTSLVCCGGTDSLELHHVVASGMLDPAWPPGGVLVSNASGASGGIKAFSDGIGGLFVLWRQSGPTTPGWMTAIHKLTHVEGDGSITPGWPVGGLVLPVSTRLSDERDLVDADTDGVGGLIVSWVGPAGFGPLDSLNIFAQRYTASGQRLWPALPTEEGFRVCTANRQQSGVRCARDGAGGAWIAWNDQRNYPFSPGQDIYASRVRSVGKATWGANGVSVFTYPADASLQALTALDSTAATMVVLDAGSAYVQRLDNTATALWDGSGVPVGILATLTLHAAGQFSVTWMDESNSQHWQRYADDRSVLWEDPLAVHPPAASILVTDVDDGDFVMWAEGTRLLASRVTAAGSPRSGWSANGDALDTTGTDHRPAGVVLDSGSGQAFALWTTTLDPDHGQSNWSIRVQRFSPAPVGVTPVVARDELSIVALSPNPSSASFTLRFRLPRAQPVRIEAFDIAGRRVAVKEASALPAGEHALELSLPASAAAGIYRVRLSAGGRSVTRTAIRLR